MEAKDIIVSLLDAEKSKETRINEVKLKLDKSYVIEAKNLSVEKDIQLKAIEEEAKRMLSEASKQAEGIIDTSKKDSEKIKEMFIELENQKDEIVNRIIDELIR